MVDLQGWFGAPEAECYRELVKKVKDGKVVEIGCWKGLSTSYIGHFCNENNTTLYAVDTFEGSASDESAGMAMKEDIKKIFINNMKELGIQCVLIKGKSVEASKQFLDESIDVVMLDANHDYHNVHADVEAWWLKIKLGGWMCGHDIGKMGVKDALDDYFGKSNYEIKHSQFGPCWWQKQKG